MKCVFIFYKDIIKGHWWFYGGFLRSLGFWKTLDDFWASTHGYCYRRAVIFHCHHITNVNLVLSGKNAEIL